MEQQYLRPDVYAEEKDRAARQLRGVATAIAAILGIAQRGPVAKPVEILGMADFERVYGGPISGESLWYAAKGFFDNGGQKCYVSRLAHYTNLETGQVAAEAASVDVPGIGEATRARYIGDADVSVIAAEDGDTLVFAINGGSNKTVTIEAVAASVLGDSGTFAGGAGTDTAEYRINGGAWKPIDLSAVSAGIANYVTALNAQMEGVSVVDDGGELRITTDRKGSSASIQLSNFGATFAAKTGLTAGITGSAGPNNVEDVDAIPFTELKAIIENDVQTAQAGDLLVAAQTADGYLDLRVVAGTPGSASTLDLVSGTSTLIASLGLTDLGSQGPENAAQGEDEASTTAAVIQAGYRGQASPGTAGNNLTVEVGADPLYASAGAGDDFAADAEAGDEMIRLTSLAGIETGSILRLSDGGTTEYVVVERVETVIVGTTVQHRVYLTAELDNGFTANSGACESMEVSITVREAGVALETWRNLSMNPDSARYAGAVLNDEFVGSNRIRFGDEGVTFPGNLLLPLAETALSGGTSERAGFTVADIIGNRDAKAGLYALDDLQDISTVICPPSHKDATTVPASAVIHNALLLYVGERRDCFAVLDPPAAQTPAQMRNYRLNTLGADSRWGALYWPRLQVADPLGVGRNPTTMVPASGAVAGVYARVDSLPPPAGGIATAPAGTDDFGRVRGVVGLEAYGDNRDHNLLNPVGVNMIRRYQRASLAESGILIMGARTLTQNPEWQYIQVRRLMTFIQQSVIQGTRWALFRNNDFKLWGQVKDVVEAFLSGLHKNGQLRGQKASEAFFVQIDASLNTADVINAGQMRARVGVAPQKPAEFIIFEFGQLQGGAEITE